MIRTYKPGYNKNNIWSYLGGWSGNKMSCQNMPTAGNHNVSITNKHFDSVSNVEGLWNDSKKSETYSR